MQEFSKSAVRYAVALYAIAGAYFWYLFYSAWLFLAQHVFPQRVSSVFSLQNSSFHKVHVAVSCLLTVSVVLSLVFYGRLREYVLEVGDELSKVSWPSLKEAQKSTALVILIVLVVGFVLFFADIIFLKAVQSVMSTAA